ncbi:MAG: hypothetical protein KAT77_06130 [Nanoarchaeota archaeon]|nr:hypothetical protein [Nanoarchaeota archaeon]
MDPAIGATLEWYVDKISKEGFGLRNGFMQENLFIGGDRETSGLFVSHDVFVDSWDCGRAAWQLGIDFMSQGFEVKYKYTGNFGSSNHVYVEVFDPDTKKWIQVDPTPWYESLDCEHIESGEHENLDLALFKTVQLYHSGGPLVSLEKQDDGSFIETYIGGSFASQLSYRLAAEYEIFSDQLRPYLLELICVHRKSRTDDGDSVLLKVGVKTREVDRSKYSFNDPIELLCADELVESKLKTKSGEVDFTQEAMEGIEENLLRNFKGNIPVIVNLIYQLPKNLYDNEEKLIIGGL